MNLRRTTLALFALALAVAAVAAPALAKGKPEKSGPSCKPRVSFNLKGTLLAADAAASKLTMHVDAANKHGRRFIGTDVEVLAMPGTKIRRQGRAELSDLMAGDLVKVQVRECKSAVDPAAPAPALTALRIVAKPAAPADEAPETETELTAPVA